MFLWWILTVINAVIKSMVSYQIMGKVFLCFPTKSMQWNEILPSSRRRKYMKYFVFVLLQIRNKTDFIAKQICYELLLSSAKNRDFKSLFFSSKIAWQPCRSILLLEEWQELRNFRNPPRRDLRVIKFVLRIKRG